MTPTSTKVRSGRLLQKGKPQDAAGLRTCIEALCDDDIAWQTAQTGDNPALAG
ncbi:exonuclease V subunit beta [Escherichia coli]|uniref:Exonuclease V subunit beta n=1 Tax=Escherichia coli TaxID=562 RepID=A0A376MIR7_ECOLX|nr:exonuclease V subunit beta [Escherichia coli]